ncbi:WAS/WASL-interacting protein family member 3 isoform 2-T3 [Spinachia spinachia]
MPAPPPPPPPPAPPLNPPPPLPPSAALPPCPWEPLKLQSAGGGGGGGGGGEGGRNALLADIQKGARLKKVTQVNDRSAPSVDKVKANTGDEPVSGAASLGSSGGLAPVGPSLGGLFAGGFPTLRPTGQRGLAGKTTVSRSSTSASVRPLWNPPTPADTSDVSEPHRPLAPSSSAPASPSHTGRHPPPSPASSTPPPAPAPPSAPPPLLPPQAFQDRAASRPPPLPSCPPPPPPYQVTKPTWLPIQHSYHTIIPQPSTPPPPPPPPFQFPFAVAGDRKSGCFYPLAPSPVHSEPSRFSILRDSPLGPPPAAPPLPASFGPRCPSTLPPPPPPPKLAAVPSPAMRSLPPSYPCNAPSRRPPAVPRSAGVGRLAPPPAPPARSPSTELSCRIPPPPPPPPLPPLSLRNGHLHNLDNFESKFQFHPVEDFPPPDEFKPSPRIYPSKENRGNLKPAGNRTHLR